MKSRIVLVVCRGNIGRSPFAESIIRNELEKRGLGSGVRVISRGTQGTLIDPEPVEFPNITYYKDLFAAVGPTISKFKVDLSEHKAKSITEIDVKQADVVLVMDSQILSAINSLFPRNQQKIHLISELIGKKFDVEDPYFTQDRFRQTDVFEQLYFVVRDGFSRLLELLRLA